MPPPRSSLPWLLLPLLVGGVAVALTGWLWLHERQAARRALRAEFDFNVRQTASRIEQRIAGYEQILRGAQGLFRAGAPIDAAAFAAYVDALLSGADFAGIQVLAYAPLAAGGDPATGVRTRYAAPAAGVGLKLLGDDPYADPVRRAALQLARDSGSVAISARLLTAPAEDASTAAASFMLCLPVYAADKSLDSIAARRAASRGWVFATVRLSDVVSSLYGEGTPGLAVSIYDGVRRAPDTLLGQSGQPGSGAGRAGPAGLHADEYIGFAGHTWTLAVSAEPEFTQHYGGDSARIIAIAGSAFSLLLALLTHQLATARSRAHAVARLMTGELRASEARYRGIVETADEGIWVTGAHGLTVFVNPKLSQLLACNATWIIGRSPAEFIVEGDWPAPAGERREWRLRAADGQPLWASVATSPILDAAGQPVGTLAMVTDITGKKQADALRGQLEAQLRESQKMEAIGTLAGGIAHDFNNILAGILGNVALAQQTSPDAAASGPLAQINQAAMRARGLVQQILAFSRRQPHKLVEQPLGPLIAQGLGLLRPILPAGVELVFKVEQAPLWAAADPTQLQQVVMNLCINAWQALQGRAGRIDVSLDAVALDVETARGLGFPAGRCARLVVADDGCGMDEATRDRVFEPFFTTKPVGQGTGLGLSVVHGIVAVHRGAIAVDSTPGQGSRFRLYFPLCDEAAVAAIEAVAAAAADPAEPAGRHVAYIDDDPVMALMVERLLARSGYRVSCFEDPQAALAVLRAQPHDVDLVVTDYNMPVLSGLDVAREMARLRPGLPVIISSGYVSEEVLAAAAAAGVRAVLQKEFTVEQLEGLVGRALASGQD